MPHPLCRQCRTKPTSNCQECALHTTGPAQVKRGFTLVDRTLDRLDEQEKPMRPPWGEGQRAAYRLKYLGILYRLGWTEAEYRDYLSGKPVPPIPQERRHGAAN